MEDKTNTREKTVALTRNGITMYTLKSCALSKCPHYITLLCALNCPLGTNKVF